ncbi:MAG: DinB family protein [Acidobacteria bacterium]|nr:DinB family protein [Acidobacteriota bacterium]MBV8891735.1 DinB family protein [Acidobacteriota bacterium]MBV9479436.1 DinB family protein [Acidobacteriota bacterium]
MSESTRLADQIRRAFEGEAWHGDSVLEILQGVKALTAAARPVKHAHTIWELVLHIAAWDEAVRQRAMGKVVTLSDRENFPPVIDTAEGAWCQALDYLKKTHAGLVETVAGFPESRLGSQVAGKSEPYYTFFYMFSGIVQHELYHGGQIVLLKKAFADLMSSAVAD